MGLKDIEHELDLVKQLQIEADRAACELQEERKLSNQAGSLVNQTRQQINELRRNNFELRNRTQHSEDVSELIDGVHAAYAKARRDLEHQRSISRSRSPSQSGLRSPSPPQ